MKKGDVLELSIDKYAFEGKGIAKIQKEGIENYVVFVSGSYPGDVVKAKLTKIKKSYSEAKAYEVIVPSNERVIAKCPYFGVCGGCKQQDLDYSFQTFYKHEQVKDLFERMGGFREVNILPIIPSENIFYYRNKMEYSFAAKKWITEEEIQSGEIFDRNFALGLHIPGMFDKVLDIENCYLQDQVSIRILNLTRQFFKSRNISIYDSKSNSGYLRNLVVKNASKLEGLMVNLVTFYEDNELMDEYTALLVKAIPEITTVVNNINLRKALVAQGDYEKLFYGDGFIKDKIGKFTYQISANSFFQTNTVQAENLYNLVLEFAEFKGDEIVYDLYAGAGTISIYMSDHVKKVYAFETVDSSQTDAEQNIKINSISNVQFIKADLYKHFIPVAEEHGIEKPDIIVTDPPRSGMHPDTVKDIITLAPSKVVYVSCNPATQVRDIKMLTEAGYELVKIKPVDMFPHTYHIENVALLIKRNEGK